MLALPRIAGIGALRGECLGEAGWVLVREGRGAAKHIPDLHPHRDFDAFHPVHNEHAQPPVEVDDGLSVVQCRARLIAAEHPDARAVLIVHVLLGLSERVEVAGEPIIADGFQKRGRAVAVAGLDSAALQPLDLLLEGKPGLRVLRHEAPPTENQPAPFGNGLIMMSLILARAAGGR